MTIVWQWLSVFLGLKVPGIVIKDEKCVRKSFVDFYEVFKEIGGRYKIL